MLKSLSLCLYSSNLGTFWLKIEQFWPFEELSIFSNGGHLGYRTALTDTILKGTHPGTIPARFDFFFQRFHRRRFKCDFLFYQNMPNLHNRYKSAERKISNKNPEHMLNYSWPCSCSSNLSSFWLILKQQLKKFLFLVTTAILNGGRGCGTQFGKGPTQGPSLPSLV
jgi:hypothetical protein